ncbi:hypothetical protein KIPB_010799, partial [Kipferlia bialata]
SGRGHQTQRIPEEFVHQPVRFSRYPHQASMAALEWVNDSQGSQPVNSGREGPGWDPTSSYSLTDTPRLPHFQLRPRLPLDTVHAQTQRETQRLPVGLPRMGSLADSEWAKDTASAKLWNQGKGGEPGRGEAGPGGATEGGQIEHSDSDEPLSDASTSDPPSFETESGITSDSELSFPEEKTHPRHPSPQLTLSPPGADVSLSESTDTSALSMTRLFVSRDSLRPSRVLLGSPSPVGGSVSHSVDDVHFTETDTCTDAREGDTPRNSERRGERRERRRHMARGPGHQLSPVLEGSGSGREEGERDREGEGEGEEDDSPRGMQQTFSSSLELPVTGNIDWGKVTSAEGRALYNRAPVGTGARSSDMGKGRSRDAPLQTLSARSNSRSGTDPLYPGYSVSMASFTGLDTSVSVCDVAHPPGVRLPLHSVRLMDPQVPRDESNVWSARVGCYQPINTSDGAQPVSQLNSLLSVMQHLGEEGNPSGPCSFVTPVDVINMLKTFKHRVEREREGDSSGATTHTQIPTSTVLSPSFDAHAWKKRYPADALPYLGFVLHTHFSLGSVVSLNRFTAALMQFQTMYSDSGTPS